MTLIKAVGAVVLAILLAIALILGTMRLGWWNPSYETVAARHAAAPSTFVMVGDVRLHVRDEGQGPVVLMLHSSMANLREWDAWADRLKTRYRVIRIDWPPYGLSIDPASSRGMPGVLDLLERFVDQQELDRFTLIGSSSGATIAVLYAAAHPERVTALALSTLPLAAPPPPDFPWYQWAMIWIHGNLVPNYYPKAYYRIALRELYGRPERLEAQTLDWYYETNAIPGGYARVREYLDANRKAVWSRGAGDEAAAVTAPILLQWGDSDPVLPAHLADAAVEQFERAPVTLLRYPDAGHYLMLEIPEITGRDLMAYLDRVHAAR